MKNILVIGATGQIGSELTLELRKRYGDDHVVAGYIPSAMPKGELKASGPSAIADVTDRQSIEVVARQFKLGKSVSTGCGMYWKWHVSTIVPCLLRVPSVRSAKLRLM